LERIIVEVTRKPIGTVNKYYRKLGVATLKISDKLKLGDIIMIEGTTTSFTQKVTSLEIDKEKVEHCDNCEVGLIVNEKVRPKDKVYSVS
jgi:hypothetical protein